MKKKYEKPEILFDDFSFSNTVAGDCEVIIDNSSEGACAYIDARYSQALFLDTVEACTTEQQEGDNNICYHTFAANSIFNS